MNLSLFCLHSSGLSGAQWVRLRQALPKREVHTPDLLGYGECTEPFQRPFHFHQDQRRLEHLLDAPCVLIGHSYGGFLALHLALARPELVRGLVLFDPIVWGVLASRDGFPPERVIPDSRFLDPTSSPEEWLECFVDFWGVPGSWAKIGARAKQSMLESYPKLREEVGSLAVDRTPHTTYEAIACPTLLLYGTNSPPVEQHAVGVLHQSIAGSELASIEGGHMAPITNFDSFFSLLSIFLDKHQL